ncbi:hypothetical protein [Paracoccus hibiscisoli]|uniref:Uncharacterized protein n=1 Tax=Paracoccus hibiscisoli TaxID=2023261 RepID=A0A4U0QUJ1_9RHOB|nr:hypothetical protein [Paracoccus hibiscisoli]TJZ85803.1 hypothetical protein FA740_05230 [Paracoccus hibiscisoli]
MIRALICAACALAPIPAAAVPPDCMSMAATQAYYEAEYGEKPTWFGASGGRDGDILIFTSPGGGWSMFRVHPGDVVCLVEHGLANTSFPRANV